MKKNILVFPCGSEIALEIYKSLKYSIHYNLIGASSVDDHGRFVYENYIGNLPYITDANFINVIRKIVSEYNIDAIYPAMDSVIALLKNNEEQIGCKIISPIKNTVNLCLSKKKTYDKLRHIISVPKLYKYDEVDSFPVFCKLNIGYGSRGAKKIDSLDSLKEYASTHNDFLICEYLPGEEYTVDCFTDRYGQLLFCAPRIRKRVMNGISVDTIPYNDNDKEFLNIIKKINNTIDMRGAWFAQFKRADNGELFLLEIAARFAGSSSLFRGCGINLAQLTLFDAFDKDVYIIRNKYNIEMDRALDNVFKIDLKYNEAFIDFDDCLVIDRNKVNTQLVSFIYQCRNNNVKVSLLSRHEGDIDKQLEKLRINTIFDRVIHLKNKEKKSSYVDNENAIFIDDSFAERKDVFDNCHIPVFGVDMVEMLLK